jgi:hypothetical protein
MFMVYSTVSWKRQYKHVKFLKNFGYEMIKVMTCAPLMIRNFFEVTDYPNKSHSVPPRLDENLNNHNTTNVFHTIFGLILDDDIAKLIRKLSDVKDYELTIA